MEYLLLFLLAAYLARPDLRLPLDGAFRQLLRVKWLDECDRNDTHNDAGSNFYVCDTLIRLDTDDAANDTPIGNHLIPLLQLANILLALLEIALAREDDQRPVSAKREQQDNRKQYRLFHAGWPHLCVVRMQCDYIPLPYLRKRSSLGVPGYDFLTITPSHTLPGTGGRTTIRGRSAIACVVSRPPVTRFERLVMRERILRRVMLCVFVALLLIPLAVSAGETNVSINGDGNAVWFIEGEQTLVMNGFDLASFGVAQPAFIDRVSIAVDTPVPGSSIEVVIYEDANGGSPSDAQLIGRTTVDIQQSGVFTAVFPTPVTVTQRAIWVGFYLPVNFRFLADTSGTSVLTYWAWTPGATFDLSSLSTAAVLGPADGTTPVNINLNGKARISFEVSASPNATPVAIATQQAGPAGSDLSVMQTFPNCPQVLWDTADEFVTFENDLDIYCTVKPIWQSPSAPQGYDRRGDLYDILFFRSGGFVLSDRLDNNITHCIRPDAADLSTAVIGVAWGSPRRWRLQPTLRFGDLICADIRRGGNLSYFVPNGLPTATPENF